MTKVKTLQMNEDVQGTWGAPVDGMDFRLWLARIHKEAQDHSEQIRARQRVPHWLVR